MRSLLFVLVAATGLLTCTSGLAIASAPSAGGPAAVLVIVGVVVLLWANDLGKRRA